MAFVLLLISLKRVWQRACQLATHFRSEKNLLIYREKFCSAVRLKRGGPLRGVTFIFTSRYLTVIKKLLLSVWSGSVKSPAKGGLVRAHRLPQSATVRARY